MFVLLPKTLFALLLVSFSSTVLSSGHSSAAVSIPTPSFFSFCWLSYSFSSVPLPVPNPLFHPDFSSFAPNFFCLFPVVLPMFHSQNISLLQSLFQLMLSFPGFYLLFNSISLHLFHIMFLFFFTNPLSSPCLVCILFKIILIPIFKASRFLIFFIHSHFMFSPENLKCQLSEIELIKH